MLIISYAHSYHMHTHIYDYEQIVYEHIIIIISVAFVAIHLKTNRMLPQNVGGGTKSVTYMGTTLPTVVHNMMAPSKLAIVPIVPIILILITRPTSSRSE